MKVLRSLWTMFAHVPSAVFTPRAGSPGDPPATLAGELLLMLHPKSQLKVSSLEGTSLIPSRTRSDAPIMSSHRSELFFHNTSCNN